MGRLLVGHMTKGSTRPNLASHRMLVKIEHIEGLLMYFADYWCILYRRLKASEVELSGKLLIELMQDYAS